MTGRPAPAAAEPATAAGQVRRLVLSDFRSYAALDLAVDRRIVALSGENGAGKTNVLEALSFLAAGRGLRRAELAACARTGGSGGWAVSAECSGEGGLVQLGTGIEPSSEPGPAARRFRLNRAPAPSIRAFAEHVRVVWLTPMMDGLLSGPAGERRRFLDRLVLAVDAEHGARVNALERALRNRNRLLEDGTGRSAWLDAAEREIAEIAVAVAAARSETVRHLASLIAASQDDVSPFPFAEIAVVGDLEAEVGTAPALAVEERYRQRLRDNRGRDAAAGRTLLGPQASDLAIRHGPKQVEAALCSTGEQKALLVGLVLAHARLVATLSGLAPLLLLDEVGAHFDPARRAALFDTLEALPGQVWMTGADPAHFTALDGRALHLHVAPGRIERSV
jgi:DNA replication and repair protein RecF